MTQKQAVRAKFREVVFKRDNNKCRVCKASDGKLDAHHITDRSELPNGGYVLENGISLCEPCHWKAEQYHATGEALPDFHPDDLYILIGSTREKAYKASLLL
jgi:5-methylcytosine-specific restriction endonuclease McrA